MHRSMYKKVYRTIKRTGEQTPRFKARRQTLCLLVVLIFTISLLGGCNDQKRSEQMSETRLLLNTYCTITIHGDVDSELLKEAFDLCAELEALLSMTIEGSDVWHINNAGGRPVQVDPKTIEVIKAGLEFGDLTDGMFDITIGRLSRLWDFNGEPYLPSAGELEEALVTVDYRQVSIDSNTVQLLNPDAWIDLGAVAKGYICDKIAGFLIGRGVSGALVDLGGDVVTVGNRQDGTPWRIGVREPFGEKGELLGVLEVTGLSVISSGTYERQFDVNGVRYHHILDPNTGMPVKTGVVSATVVVESALTGEGISTSIILNRAGGLEYLFYHFPGFVGAVVVLENGELLWFGDLEFVKQG